MVWDLAWMSRTMGRFLHWTEDERIVAFPVRLPLDDDEPSTLFLVASGLAGLMFVTPDELDQSKKLMNVPPYADPAEYGIKD